MSSPGNPPACDGMYAKLIDEEAADIGFSIRPQVSGKEAPPPPGFRLSFRPTACHPIITTIIKPFIL